MKITDFIGFALIIAVEHFLKNREIFQSHFICNAFSQLNLCQHFLIAGRIIIIKFVTDIPDLFHQVFWGLQHRIKKYIAVMRIFQKKFLPQSKKIFHTYPDVLCHILCTAQIRCYSLKAYFQTF